MTMIVYSTLDDISFSVGEALLKRANAVLADEQKRFTAYSSDVGRLVKIISPLVDAKFLDDLAGGEKMVLISRHTSKHGVLSMTTHSPGNWSDDTRDGGRPNELSCAAPELMLSNIISMSKCAGGAEITYEATHHGPFLRTPSIFVEVGGPESVPSVAKEALVEAICGSAGLEAEYDKIAIGIGCGHYPSKFTKLSLEGKYAFGHIMPKHYCDNVGMLEQAIERSSPKPEVAVIEWKGLNSPVRTKIIERLGELGLDYERV
jgi:D-aminoacyl-tRNA deacylase